MADRLFRDRRDAGRRLARLLGGYRGRPRVVVLALPRGGVPVGYEVAAALGAPLDAFLVRKLGVPGRSELAMGAIASGGVVVLNDDVITGLGIDPETVQQVAEQEAAELQRREQAYRGQRTHPDLTGKTVILADDGLATGSSMRAAILAVRKSRPARIVVAVPAAPISTRDELAADVDEVVCVTTPSPFYAVGLSYWDFDQTTDDEVRGLLAASSAAPASMVSGSGQDAVSAIRSVAIPVEHGVPPDDVLLELVGDARFVLIGEASHGTHEFYAARAAMTRLLIEELDFCAVAAEADWPDAYRVNCYVRGRGGDSTAEEALRGFERFPGWMWRNSDVRQFTGWLREHNDRIPQDSAKAGFYGLDMYSLHRSAHEVISYLDRMDPAAAARARDRYSCLDHHGEDGGSSGGQAYGLAAAFGAGEACARHVVEQLVDLQRIAPDYARRNGLLATDEQFYAECNARTVMAAEQYYRSMFSSRASTWNLRDRHMADILDALAVHLSSQRGRPARIVVWAHNSHLGDARATEAAARHEHNVGQLVRQRHPGESRLIGFTTYTGTVTAADSWGGPADRKHVRPALPGSVEELLHEVGQKEFMLAFHRAPQAASVLRAALLERAIGVIYRPQTERRSHYFQAKLARQFDAVIHIDETRALEPLERTQRWEHGEVPETYPFAV